MRTRVDRKKKRKASMSGTPPSSTPRPKKKGKKTDKTYIFVDDDCKNPVKSDLNEYKGRSDYCGHGEATEEEKCVLTTYLSREDLKAREYAINSSQTNNNLSNAPKGVRGLGPRRYQPSRKRNNDAPQESGKLVEKPSFVSSERTSESASNPIPE